MVRKPAPAYSRFAEIVELIEAARARAYRFVNTELVELYWQIGKYISAKLARAEWGDGVVDELAADLAQRYPGQRGFTRSNLFRMRQFFDAYRSEKVVAPLVRQLAWTLHLVILGGAKEPATRAYYVRTAIKERWSKRELERQIRSGAALRSSAKAKKVSPVVTQLLPAALDELKNVYSLEFLGLPAGHSEADLHGALLRNLGMFIAELGRDFCFVGSQYPVQVGHRDFSIDLVEALDRDVKKPHERPSIGVLLCANKSDEIVEYALARTTSPALVAEYQTALPSKAVLRAKLHELYARLSPQ
jgi:predicted nuclease of restriction endonuclease-like (RecB) superfamily